MTVCSAVVFGQGMNGWDRSYISLNFSESEMQHESFLRLSSKHQLNVRPSTIDAKLDAYLFQNKSYHFQELDQTSRMMRR